MPNVRSAIKRMRSDRAKAVYNKNKKSELKTFIKRTEQAVEASEETAEATFRMTQKKLDQAVAKGLIHKNKAARKIAQLAKKLNAQQ